MTNSPIPEGERYPVNIMYLLAGAVLVAIVAVTVLRFWAPRSDGGIAASPPKISVEPRSQRLGDSTYREGDTVSARFSIVNPLQVPVTIRGIHTSCSCMATLPGTGLSLPFEIAPGSHAEFWVQGSVRPGPELNQAYSIEVEAWCNGVPLPESFASLSFRVEDVLKAYPIAIKLGEVPIDQPVHRKIYLYTINRPDGGSMPTLRVSGSPSIRATIAAGDKATSDAIPRDFKVQYLIDVILEPGQGEASSSGTIDVLGGNRTLLSIPVQCSYQHEYRISADHIDVEGRSGQQFVREIFIESESPSWSEISVPSLPEGITASVDRFDAKTRVVRAKIQVPPAGRVQRGEILLKSGDGLKTIRIPVRVAAEKG